MFNGDDFIQNLGYLMFGKERYPKLRAFLLSNNIDICDQLFAVAKVQHYRRLSTNLENLYNSIKELLETQKESTNCFEYKGFLNSVPLRSIVAVNTSPKVWAGSLREIHVSITGNPDDYAVEVASGV